MPQPGGCGMFESESIILATVQREGKRLKSTGRRFVDRCTKEWPGPIVDYKEVELLRKFMTTSSKLMSRRRASTNMQEQKALKNAVKLARFMGLLPYTGS